MLIGVQHGELIREQIERRREEHQVRHEAHGQRQPPNDALDPLALLGALTGAISVRTGVVLDAPPSASEARERHQLVARCDQQRALSAIQ